MKIINKKYWKYMKNFVERISIKFGDFFLIKMVLKLTLLQKIWWAEKYLFVEIQKSTYPISCLLDQN